MIRTAPCLALVIVLLLSAKSFAQPAAAPSAPPATAKPNILFVFIDDMGNRDLSCFGGTRVKTEQIDKLASEGQRFDWFYVASPICSPSRVGFLTGQYPVRWKITSFLNNRADDARRGMADWLSLDAPTLARPLQAAGYHTAHVGKWHMGGQRDVADAPKITEYGFNTSITNFEGLGPRILAKFEKTPNHGPTMTSAKFGGPGVEWAPRDEVSARFVDRAIAEIDNATKANKPFYINLWPDDVHSPCEAPKALRGDDSPAANYLGVLKELDRQLGRVFDHVRNDPKLRESTIILLASDNGHEGGLGTAGSMRGSKGQLYEGGIRSPLIVWAPGRVAKTAKAGSVNKTTVVTAIDLAPSLLSIAGVQPVSGTKFDGSDMSATLLGQSSEPRKTPAMWVRPVDRPGPKGKPLPDLAMRDGDWKLLVKRDGSNAELFNLAKDPDEKNNVAAKQAERAKKMSDAVIAWDKEIEPNPPSVEPEGAGK